MILISYEIKFMIIGKKIYDHVKNKESLTDCKKKMKSFTNARNSVPDVETLAPKFLLGLM